MITSIKLIAETLNNIRFSESDLYDQFNCSGLTLPIADDFINFSQSIAEKDKNTVLTTFANNLATSCLHYLALFAFCDYAQGKTVKTAEMYNAIDSMLNRPGPGKWLGFLRTYYHYTKETDFESRFPEIIAFIEKHEIDNKKNPAVEVCRNYNNEVSDKMGLLEFLVEFRNTIAHSKGYDEKTVEVLAAPIIQVATILAKELSFLTSYHLVATGSDGKEIMLINEETINDFDVNSDHTISIKTGSDCISLHPLFILDKGIQQPDNDVFLLESVKKGKAIFSSHSVTLTKSFEKDPYAARLFGLLEQIYVEPWQIDEKKVTWQKLKERSLKLLVSLYPEKPFYEQGLPDERHAAIIKALEVARESFINSGKRVLFLTSGENQIKGFQKILFDPGSWVFDEAKDILIPVVPDMINNYLTGDEPFSFERVISEELGISGDLKNIFSMVCNKQTDARIFLIIDGLDQISFKEKHVALKHLFDFIYRLKEVKSVFFIIHSAPDFYNSSFKKYLQVFRDKIEDVTYISNNRIVTSLCEKNEEKSGIFSKVRKVIFSFLSKG